MFVGRIEFQRTSVISNIEGLSEAEWQTFGATRYHR